jgi:Xaa-Pro aminopeptidase
MLYLSIRVDGEEIDVELQDLLNNYSGKVSYDKKFQEFSSDKKEFEGYKQDYDKQIENINTYINNFADKIKNNDPLGALSYFAEFSGMKPHEFKRELLNQIAPEVERRSIMSTEELKAEELQSENEYLLKQQESVQEQSKQEQSRQELEQEIATVQEAHGISDEAFENAYQELKDSDYEGDINPQAIAEYHMHSEAFSRAGDILSSVNPTLADQDQVVESLQKVIVENPSFDNDDLKEIVEEVYGDMIKQASKTVSKKAEPKKQETKTPRKKDNVVDWDDL